MAYTALQEAAPHLRSAVQGQARLDGRQRWGLAAGCGGGDHEHQGGPYQETAGATNDRLRSLCPPHIKAAHLRQAQWQYEHTADRGDSLRLLQRPKRSVSWEDWMGIML